MCCDQLTCAKCQPSRSDFSPNSKKFQQVVSKLQLSLLASVKLGTCPNPDGD